VIESITTGASGDPDCPLAGSPSIAIRSTTSSPELTSPSSAKSAGNPASAATTTKNWLPERPGGSTSVFAIATVPRV
jgi:hypothetical protein